MSGLYCSLPVLPKSPPVTFIFSYLYISFFPLPNHRFLTRCLLLVLHFLHWKRSVSPHCFPASLLNPCISYFLPYSLSFSSPFFLFSTPYQVVPPFSPCFLLSLLLGLSQIPLRVSFIIHTFSSSSCLLPMLFPMYLHLLSHVFLPSASFFLLSPACHHHSPLSPYCIHFRHPSCLHYPRVSFIPRVSHILPKSSSSLFVSLIPPVFLIPMRSPSPSVSPSSP